VDTLENLRSIKSSLEGSEVKVTAPEVSQEWLLELKQLSLMHVPSSLTDSVRLNFSKLIKQSFQGICYFNIPLFNVKGVNVFLMNIIHA
jgi:hypothetical protein